jgi:hypothetical protein
VRASIASIPADYRFPRAGKVSEDRSTRVRSVPPMEQRFVHGLGRMNCVERK